MPYCLIPCINLLFDSLISQINLFDRQTASRDSETKLRTHLLDYTRLLIHFCIAYTYKLIFITIILYLFYCLLHYFVLLHCLNPFFFCYHLPDLTRWWQYLGAILVGRTNRIFSDSESCLSSVTYVIFMTTVCPDVIFPTEHWNTSADSDSNK